jgi:hypothetical protein
MMRLVLLAIGLFTFTLSYGQFTSDREKFVKEMQKALADYGHNEEAGFIKKEFSAMLLETSDMPDKYFVKMVETVNAMQVRRLKPYPDMYRYVFSVYSFAKNKQPGSSYDAWHNSVDKLLEAKNAKKFTDFMEFSSEFFSEKRIVKATNFDWYFYGAYTFEYNNGAMVRFTDGTLVCGAPNTSRKTRDEMRFVDSIVIYKTSGVFDPDKQLWTGKGGKLDWQKSRLPAGETFAELGNYDFLLTKASIRIDTVKLTTPYFSKPIYGQLADQATKGNADRERSYPQFNSFEKRLQIKNIRPQMDYEGGFSLQGADLEGKGDARNPASLTIYRNGKPFIKTGSNILIISPEKISAHASTVKIYVSATDSIYHPGLDFQYTQDKDIVELVRGKTGVAQAPFADSYHQLDMYVPRMTWDRKASELVLTYEFGTSQEQRVARLESFNF